jgi:hypothetical protein
MANGMPFGGAPIRQLEIGGRPPNATLYVASVVIAPNYFEALNLRSLRAIVHEGFTKGQQSSTTATTGETALAWTTRPGKAPPPRTVGVCRTEPS